MLLQVNGVGNQKIEYKDHATIEFDSLNNYLTMAKKTISKFANSTYSGLAHKMLKDEDAVANVANAIMMADWRWDENYKNQKGTKKNKYSYRNQCALWAIQTYATKNRKKPKNLKKVYSLNHDIDGEDRIEMYQLTADVNAQSPDEISIDNENKTIIADLIDRLLSLECLSDRQKDYIRLYYFEDYTFEKIGNKYGITREAVRQGLNKALATIRNTIDK
jgi:RNA polymerase sigma factor (sigma-70 family)